MRAEFGWTVVQRHDGIVKVYKRDCAICEMNRDLEMFTFPTREQAENFGESLKGDPSLFGKMQDEYWNNYRAKMRAERKAND